MLSKTLDNNCLALNVKIGTSAGNILSLPILLRIAHIIDMFLSIGDDTGVVNCIVLLKGFVTHFRFQTEKFHVTHLYKKHELVFYCCFHNYHRILKFRSQRFIHFLSLFYKFAVSEKIRFRLKSSVSTLFVLK